MNKDVYPPKTLELVYNEVKDALNTQLQSVDGLNTKTSVIIGFIGVIVGISLNLYPHSNPCLFGLCMTSFLISTFFALSAYGVKSYRKDPEPRKLTENYLRDDDGKVKKQLIDNFIQSFEKNKITIEKKVRYINYALILHFIGLIVLTLSILVG